jgi:2-polyprenyl-6-methoxyphenol hydroxylase-like FAD-dependent oxidoreductase
MRELIKGVTPGDELHERVRLTGATRAPCHHNNVSDVVIAGAGIGGLTLAVALQRRGIRVRVFERANQLTAAGAGIALPANGVKALQKLHLDQAVKRAGMVVERAVILDSRGRELGSEVDLTDVYRSMGASLVALHRGRLHAVLLDAVGDTVVTTGTRVASFEQDRGSVHVALMDGQRIDAGLLVGADGLHSSVRTQLIGTDKPVYSGYTSWRGVTPSNTVTLPHRTSESWGRGERFGIVPIGLGEIYWFAVANSPPDGEDIDVRRELMTRFGSWHEPVAAIIEATPPDRILRTDICDRDPIARWHAGRVVLLGDAAHPMTPNLGQGAGQAIEDAVVLDECLAASSSIEEALTHYEQRRVARANAIVRASRRFGAVAQWSNPVAAWVRDRAMSLTPASVAVNQARKLMEF